MSAAATPNTAPKPERAADLIAPLGIIGVILMMIMPLPAAMLDALLGVSIALAIGVFLTALFIEEALEFSSFPSFVLVATLLRLSLNVATTRLILLHGGEGHGAAGEMVEAFGRFVVGGNVVVGLVVFLILVVINFVVITKGAGRVAEVAARFTLDAMPGKQMAIDADLASGAMTPDQARVRRKNLEREADFYGAMDGASKFVHGDAIAGLLITAINLIGGLVLGIAGGMDIGKAAETFSVLSVGDALVSQIPALLVSSASGIVVTRSATGEQLGRAFAAQLFAKRRSVMITAAIIAIIGVIPGMPTFTCFALAGGLAALARKLPKDGQVEAPEAAKKPDAPAVGSSVDIDAALALDVLTLELGFELVNLVDAAAGGTLIHRVSLLRREIAQESGFVVPPVNVTDNLSLAPGAYRVLLLGNEIGRGLCAGGRMLAIDPSGSAPMLEGDPTTDPSFGMRAIWIYPRDREMAEALGYTVVDHAVVIATHLGELVRASAHKLLGRQEAQHLLDVLAKTTPKLVDDVVPSLLGLGDVVRVFKNLLRERVSIRDMRTIMEALGELAPQTKDVEQLTELVRERLSSHITARVKGPDGTVAALTLDPRLEEILRRSLREIASGTGGALDPELLRNVSNAAERALGKFSALGASPTVITAPDLRRYARAIFERRIPSLSVFSFREIDPSTPLRVVETLGMGAVPALSKQGAQS
ncbi:MAG: flagellar biosynthesis protein FlhA [Polyangiaceae bacterium]